MKRNSLRADDPQGILCYQRSEGCKSLRHGSRYLPLMINGIRAGDYELAPEATAYNTYLQVQTYDVTELLERGNNAAAVVLSTGWWAGRIGHYGESVQYGDRMGLLMQIHILYEDGTETVIGTDESFLSSEGERRYGELCIGENMI